MAHLGAYSSSRHKDAQRLYSLGVAEKLCEEARERANDGWALERDPLSPLVDSNLHPD